MEEIQYTQHSARHDDQREPLSHKKTLADTARDFNLDCQREP